MWELAKVCEAYLWQRARQQRNIRAVLEEERSITGVARGLDKNAIACRLSFRPMITKSNRHDAPTAGTGSYIPSSALLGLQQTISFQSSGALPSYTALLKYILKLPVWHADIRPSSLAVLLATLAALLYRIWDIHRMTKHYLYNLRTPWELRILPLGYDISRCVKIQSRNTMATYGVINLPDHLDRRDVELLIFLTYGETIYFFRGICNTFIRSFSLKF